MKDSCYWSIIMFIEKQELFFDETEKEESSHEENINDNLQYLNQFLESRE